MCVLPALEYVSAHICKGRGGCWVPSPTALCLAAFRQSLTTLKSFHIPSFYLFLYYFSHFPYKLLHLHILCSILKNTFQYLSMIKEVYWRLLSVIKRVHNFYLWKTLKFGYRVDLFITSSPLLCGRSFLSFLRRLLTLPPPQQGPSSPQPSRSRVRMWRGGGFSQHSPERHTQSTIPACTAAVRSCLHACLTLRTCRGLWHNELRFRFPSSIFAFQKMPRPNVGIRK